MQMMSTYHRKAFSHMCDGMMSFLTVLSGYINDSHSRDFLTIFAYCLKLNGFVTAPSALSLRSNFQLRHKPVVAFGQQIPAQ